MAHICHLTVLNPARHTRIFYKLALSQKALGYQVTIIGQDDRKEPYKIDGIQIIPRKPFHRLSLPRLLSVFSMLIPALKSRADIFTIHTPELLFTAWYLRRVKGANIIYDLHEDYAVNIRHARHYPPWMRALLAKFVRWIEKQMVRHFSAISMAEEVYQGILDEPESKRFFLRNKFTEKAIPQYQEFQLPQGPYMLYTGTIAAEWGIFRTIDLWENLCKIQPIRLVIAGYTPIRKHMEEVRQQIKKTGSENEVKIIGGVNYVPYSQISKLIANCEFGTALYDLTPGVKGKIPTKFYEYMAFGKPLIFTPDMIWEQMNTQMALGIPYQEGDDISTLPEKIQTYHLRPRPTKEDYHWSGEEDELKIMLEMITNQSRSDSA